MLLNVLSRLLDICKQISLETNQAFKQRDNYEIESKGHQDWVTEADRHVESQLKIAIAESFPNHNFFGEEFGGKFEAPCWVIDPIDGTTNFLYGIADFAISLAFVDSDGPAIGIICCPAHDRIIYAVRDYGAWENEVALKPRSVAETELLIGLNLNYKPGIPEEFMKHSQMLINNGHQIRVSGSAAWTLTQVACGELDGCYMGNVNVWDTLAAQLICNESGLDTAPYFYKTGAVYAFPKGAKIKKEFIGSYEKSNCS